MTKKWFIFHTPRGQYRYVAASRAEAITALETRHGFSFGVHRIEEHPYCTVHGDMGGLVGCDTGNGPMIPGCDLQDADAIHPDHDFITVDLETGEEIPA